jgi:site-specific recombinase XerD
MWHKKAKGRKIHVWLTKDEIAKMLEVAPNIRDQTLIYFGYYTGFRVSEISHTIKSDISFEEGTIKVREGKGNKDRIIAMHPTLKKVMEYWTQTIKPDGFIFAGRKGKSLGSRQIHRIVKDTAKLAGITKNVHPHTLRHSIAQNLLNDGAGLITISRFLGHEDVSTTQIYADADVTHMKKMMEGFK